MKRASITEAKNGLSALLDLVRHGETVIIEDRGRPVARLEGTAGRHGAGDARGLLARLERQGVIRCGTGKSASILRQPPPALKGELDAVQILIDERRSGR